MKITEVRTFLVGNPWKNWVFVKVHTDEGLTGLGEASPMAGAFFGRDFSLWTVRNRTFHSRSERNSVQGVSGSVLAINVIIKRRQATMLMTVR